MTKKRLIFVLPCLYIIQILFLIGSRGKTNSNLFYFVMGGFADSNSFIITGDLSTSIQFLGRSWIFGIVVMSLILLGFLFTARYAILEKKLHMVISAGLYAILVLFLVIPWILASFFKIHLTISALAYDYLLAPSWTTPISLVINIVFLLAVIIFSIPELLTWRKQHFRK